MLKRLVLLTILISALAFPTSSFASTGNHSDNSGKNGIFQILSSFLGNWGSPTDYYSGSSWNDTQSGNKDRDDHNRDDQNKNDKNKQDKDKNKQNNWSWGWDWDSDWDDWNDHDWDFDDWYDKDKDFHPTKDSFDIWKKWFCY